MSEFTSEILKLCVAKICTQIGWHCISSTPLEILTDLLRRYLQELSKLTGNYATLFGHQQPNLDELGLAFRDMHINIADLEEYIQYVDSSPVKDLPSYPVPKESHLNFLKPGSNEVVTRPVHIHEHLPPMLTEKEDTDMSLAAVIKEETPACPTAEYGGVVFKRPADILNDTPSKRPRLLIEEEGRPTREISSVMMTTSGFLSPAREGKLPESRTPTSSQEQIAAASMQPNYTTAPSNIIPRFDRKNLKAAKELKKIDKRKERNTSKELFKPIDEVTIKKIPAKEVKKNNKNNHNVAPVPEVVEKPPTPVPKTPKTVGAKSKGPKGHKEKIVHPPPVEKLPPQPIEEKIVEGKLSTEPDKVKLNIFKKISKVKEDKVDKAEKKIKEEPRPEIQPQSRESSPDLIIDESDNKNWDHSRNSFPPEAPKEKPKEKPVQPDLKFYETIKDSPRSEKDFGYDDYMSPPGTPLTPKTPEMPSHSPPSREKRKKKEKNKLNSKKLKVSKKHDPEIIELDRPKTPDPINLVKTEPPPIVPPQGVFINNPHFFPSFSSGPGLIPPPFANPLLSRLPVNFKHGFGQPAHIPAMSNLASFAPIKQEEPEQPPPIVDIKPEKEEFPPQVKEKHKKDKKDKVKKKSKKDKVKNKSEKRKLKEEKKEKEKIKKIKKEKKKEKEREQHDGSVPKLMLRISSPRPPTPDVQLARKIMIKPVVKKEETSSHTSSASESQEQRQPSPELARISALITRPPKLKTKESHAHKEEVAATPVTPAKNGPSTGRGRLCNLNKAPPPGSAPHEEKPIAGKMPKTTPNPPAPQVRNKETEENKVWICPACGRQDDGSPMIGCDDCDAWYHWVCVGIQVPPDDSEDWYCRICIVKKQEQLQVDKKKKRKKRDKKNQD